MAIYSEFSHWKWWFSIVILVYWGVHRTKWTMPSFHSRVVPKHWRFTLEFWSPGVQVTSPSLPHSFQRTACRPRSPRYHRAQSLVQALGNLGKTYNFRSTFPWIQLYRQVCPYSLEGFYWPSLLRYWLLVGNKVCKPIQCISLSWALSNAVCTRSQKDFLYHRQGFISDKFSGLRVYTFYTYIYIYIYINNIYIYIYIYTYHCLSMKSCWILWTLHSMESHNRISKISSASIPWPRRLAGASTSNTRPWAEAAKLGTSGWNMERVWYSYMYMYIYICTYWGFIDLI